MMSLHAERLLHLPFIQQFIELFGGQTFVGTLGRDPQDSCPVSPSPWHDTSYHLLSSRLPQSEGMERKSYHAICESVYFPKRAWYVFASWQLFPTKNNEFSEFFILVNLINRFYCFSTQSNLAFRYKTVSLNSKFAQIWPFLSLKIRQLFSISSV